MTLPEFLFLFIGVICCRAEPASVSESPPGNEKSCSRPPPVQNGYIIEILKQSYPSGSFVRYICVNFYKLEGKEIIRCKDGEWEQAPTCREPCTITSADMLQNNIRLKYKSGDEKTRKLYVTHFDNMTFECVPGYEIADAKRLRTQCLNGVVKYPKCLKEGYCTLQETEMALNNVRYSESTEIENGQAIVFICTEGMAPEESLEAKCQNRNIKYPRCIAPRICDPPEISNGKLIPKKDRYDAGSLITIECEELYVHNGQNNAICEEGRWSELPQCFKPCTVSSTGLDKNNIELVSPEDALMTHKHGTDIRVKCKRKFRRRGQLSAFCYDGEMKYQRCFSGRTCHLDQQQMDDNSLELHDKHDGESLYGEGETVQFICKAGYFNRASLTATCAKPTDPYSVSAEPALAYPSCIRFRQSCGPPPMVQNGDILEEKNLIYLSGLTVHYRCASWYTLEGKAIITCRHGEWDKEPVCRAPCTVRTTDMVQNNIRLKYAFLDDVRKEIYSQHFDNITFECKPGYGIPDVKSLRIQCLDGVLKYPKCLKEGYGESCGPPPAILYGDTVDTKKPSYQPGSSVKFKCASFYVLEGNELITCKDGEWGKEPTCRAPCTITTSTMLENNIQLKYKPDGDKTRKLYVSHLDYVSFECAPGYNIDDTKHLRFQCLDGVKTYPKCLK